MNEAGGTTLVNKLGSYINWRQTSNTLFCCLGRSRIGGGANPNP